MTVVRLPPAGGSTIVTSESPPAAAPAGRVVLASFEAVPNLRDLLYVDEADLQQTIRALFPAASEYEWRPYQAGAVLPQGHGVLVQALGAVTHPAFENTSLGYRPRARFTTGALYSGLYSGTADGTGLGVSRPGAIVGGTAIGGYYHECTFAVRSDAAATSAFVGLGQQVPGGTATPITRAHHVGLSFEAASAPGSPWRLTRNDGSASGVAVDLSAGQPGVINALARGVSTAPIRVRVFSPAGGGALGVRVDREDGPRAIVPIFRALFVGGQIPTSAIAGAGASLVVECYLRNDGAASEIDCYGFRGVAGG